MVPGDEEINSPYMIPAGEIDYLNIFGAVELQVPPLKWQTHPIWLKCIYAPPTRDDLREPQGVVPNIAANVSYYRISGQQTGFYKRFLQDIEDVCIPQTQYGMIINGPIIVQVVAAKRAQPYQMSTAGGIDALQDASN